LTFNGNSFVNANSTLTVNSVATFAGSMSGPSSLTLTKAGTSILTLAASNSFAGNMNVNAGTVAITNSGAFNGLGVLNLGNGGTVSVSAVAPYSTPSTLTLAGAGGVMIGSYNHAAGTISPGTGIGNFTAGSVNFNGGLQLSGGAVFFDLNGAATTGSDQIIVGAGGSLNMSGGRVAVNFLSAPSGTLPRTYTIASYTTKSGALSNLTFDSRANIGTVDTGTAIQVTVNSYTAGQLTWNGTTSNTWDLSTTPNWQNASATADKFFQLDNVAFTDASGVQTTVNLTTFAAPASIVANNSTNNYTISGPGVIGGTGTLTKTGTGRLIISASASYTGVTTVAQGTLSLVGPTAWNPALNGTNGSVLTGGRLVFDYTGNVANDPVATIKTILTATSFAGNFLTGKLRTTTAADGRHAIGWFDDTANSVLVTGYTYLGDANVDGIVNTIDFNALAANFNTATVPVWAQGDFNYDGKVNALDFNMVAGNFGATPITAPTLGSLVPEPASLGLIGLGLASLMSRRVRHNRCARM
jgi:autotransporter-associated beta strand protein